MATNKTDVSHPSYHEIIGEAIIALKDRTRSSQVAIAKYIEQKHKGMPENFKKMLSVQLKRLGTSGNLTKVKASFKLAKPFSSEKKKDTKSKGASVKKAKTMVNKKATLAKAAHIKKKASPAKAAQMKKAGPSKVKVTPVKKNVTGVAKQKMKKVGKSSSKKADVAKKATK